MIANARMYSVSPAAAALWRALLEAIIAAAGLHVTVVEHPEPAPIDPLWRREDKAAVFMCGLPFSQAEPRPMLVAAPIPSPAEFAGEACYWSDLVVREDSAFRTVEDTFGGRLAFTVPGSQSGCVAALCYFMSARGAVPVASRDEIPLFGEIIGPTITPLGALTAVVRGAADVAPIDSYAFRLLRQYRPELTSQVRIVGSTAPTPIPPLVASQPPLLASLPQVVGAQEDLDALQSAFLEAHQNASIKKFMDPLLLLRFTRPDPESYAVLRDRYAAATRYWSLHRLAALTHPAFA